MHRMEAALFFNYCRIAHSLLKKVPCGKVASTLTTLHSFFHCLCIVLTNISLAAYEQILA